jgi:fatty acid desaturase
MRIFGNYYVVTRVALFVHHYRAPVAHANARDGRALGIEEMIADVITIPAHSMFFELWDPLHVRYEGLHHMYPGLPYHALPEAHQRLMATLPADHTNRSTVRRSSLVAIRELHTRHFARNARGVDGASRR